MIDKPETVWLEKKDGPGIGERVKIGFKEIVTANKLFVSPGYFDSRYWKALLFHHDFWVRGVKNN